MCDRGGGRWVGKAMFERKVILNADKRSNCLQ
jgi:hypothetical protein